MTRPTREEVAAAYDVLRRDGNAAREEREASAHKFVGRYFRRERGGLEYQTVSQRLDPRAKWPLYISIESVSESDFHGWSFEAIPDGITAVSVGVRWWIGEFDSSRWKEITEDEFWSAYEERLRALPPIRTPAS